jgi:hypothetical protein
LLKTYHTSLKTDYPQEELQLILAPPELRLEIWRAEGGDDAAVPVSRLSLPLALWPRFYEAVCCLGAFMKPLPAPAYQTRACCSYTCSLPPETVVLETDRGEQMHLSLEDRRGSTFLEIKSVKPAAVENSGEARTIRIGPTCWSAFLTTLQGLAQVMAAQ